MTPRSAAMGTVSPTDGMKPDPAKIAIVRHMEPPKDKDDLDQGSATF